MSTQEAQKPEAPQAPHHIVDPRNARTISAAIKLGIFLVVSLVVTGTLAAIMGSIGVGKQSTYSALFTTASELKAGDDVRVAGVTVGDVDAVEIVGGTQAKITFTVDAKVPLTTASGAEVRYLNLVGDRYMALTEGTPGAGRLHPGGVIPVAQTKPAINLTELFNGFQPLFQALSPDDMNTLANNMIKVLQGEGGTIKGLLAETASLTSALADRDELISSVITNLTTTLSTVDAHRTQLGDLITQLSAWMTDLAGDRESIGDSVHQISDLTSALAGLLTNARPWTKADIVQLRRVMEILNRPENQAIMDETMNRLPKTLRAQARIGTHGSWYNYYLCDFDMNIKMPAFGDAIDNSPAMAALQDSLKSMAVYSQAQRCEP